MSDYSTTAVSGNYAPQTGDTGAYNTGANTAANPATSPFDFSGAQSLFGAQAGLMNTAQQLFGGGYGGSPAAAPFVGGGVNAGGQTVGQVVSGDPGSQLQGTQAGTPGAPAPQPTVSQPQAPQGGISALLRSFLPQSTMASTRINPYVPGSGATPQAPAVPAVPGGASSMAQLFGFPPQSGLTPLATRATPSQLTNLATQMQVAGNPQPLAGVPYSGAVGPDGSLFSPSRTPGAPGMQAAAAPDDTGDGKTKPDTSTTTPDPEDPKDPANQPANYPVRQGGRQGGQQRPGMDGLQQFMRSPLFALFNQLTGGRLGLLLGAQGIGGLLNQMQYGGRQIPGWNQPGMLPNQAGSHMMPGDPSTFGGPQYAGATPSEEPDDQSDQDERQPRKTTQLEPNVTQRYPADPKTGLAPGMARDAQGNLTWYGQPPDTQTPGRYGPGSGAHLPAWSQVPAGINPANALPYAANEINPGDAQSFAAQGLNPATGQPYERGDINPGDAAMLGAENAAARGPYPNTTIQGRQANVMAAGGMSQNAIAGVMQNIKDESAWNPMSREGGDQPRYSGEANFSHGLYQEGGPDWPLYQQFLRGRDWRDPTLQTQFMMQHFKQRSPGDWNRMNNARTPGEAAQIFVQAYLRPARQYMLARSSRYGRGVPSVQQRFAMR